MTATIYKEKGLPRERLEGQSTPKKKRKGKNFTSSALSSIKKKKNLSDLNGASGDYKNSGKSRLNGGGRK